MQNKVDLFQARLGIFDRIVDHGHESGTCPVCMETMDHTLQVVLPCSHMLCVGCTKTMMNNTPVCGRMKCPLCCDMVNQSHVHVIRPTADDTVPRVGSKLDTFVSVVASTLHTTPDSKILVYTRWRRMVRVMGGMLRDRGIAYATLGGSGYTINAAMDSFHREDGLCVLLLCTDTIPCGVYMDKVTDIIFADIFHHESDTCVSIEERVLRSCVRTGRQPRVRVTRLIVRDTIEDRLYAASCKQRDVAFDVEDALQQVFIRRHANVHITARIMRYIPPHWF